MMEEIYLQDLILVAIVFIQKFSSWNIFEPAALWKQNQLIAKLPSCSQAPGGEDSRCKNHLGLLIVSAVPGYHFLTLNVINFSIYILSLCCHGWNTFVRFATWNTKAIKVQIFLIPAGQKKIWRYW